MAETGRPVRRSDAAADRAARPELAIEDYKRITDFMQEAMSVVTADGIFLYANRVATYNLTGGRLSEIAGMRLADFVPDDQARRLIDRYRHTLATGTVSVEDVRVSLPGGDRWFHNSLQPICYGPEDVPALLSVSLDITDQVRAEEALQRERALLTQITETSPVGITTLDRDGQIAFANRRAEEILGLTAAGITERRYNSPVWVITGLDGEPFPDDQLPFVRVMASGRPVYDIRHAIQWADGRRVVLSINAEPMHDAAGLIAGVVATLADITEQLRIEARLRQAEKMDAIGQLAGGIAHDFNNQLSGVLGYADMLVNRLEDPTLRRYAGGICTAARRAADLTQQLLAFARKGKYLNVPIDMHRVIGEAVELLRRSIDKRIEIKQHLDANPSSVLGDPTQLQSALLNLGLNARDAMPQGGEILFATRVAVLDDVSPGDDLAAGRCLQVSVTDTGIGMTAETKRRIFEPFFTTKEIGKGTGLGLASVYGAIKSHRGAIRVHSEPGRGSTFDLYLPLREDPTRDAVSPTAAPTAGIRGGRILLIDDEPIILEVGGDMLRELGYAVVARSDPAEALALYQQEWRTFDLVILDMVMPKLGGKELFLAMRETNPQIKAILSSGYSLNGEAQCILDQGVLAFVQKPFNTAELQQTVADVLQSGSHQGGQQKGNLGCC